MLQKLLTLVLLHYSLLSASSLFVVQPTGASDSAITAALEMRLSQQVGMAEGLSLFSLPAPVVDTTDTAAVDSVDSCDMACKIGKARKAGATYLLLSSVSNFGELWTLTAKLMHAESGKTESFAIDITGSVEEFVQKAPQKLVQDVATLLHEKSVCYYTIASEPEGAAVLIDGKRRGKTPLRLKFKGKKPAAIALALDWYDTLADTLQLTPGDTLEKRYELAHSQMWHDSVTQAKRDSIIAAASRSMKASFPEALAQLTFPFAGSTDSFTVAVVPFQSSDSLNEVGQVSAEYALNYLVQQPQFTVVDRENFKSIVQELELSMTAMISDESALEAGKMLAANYILTGKLTGVSGGQTLFMKLINVETGEIKVASAAELKPAQMDQLHVDVLGEKLSPSSAAFRSAVAPGWGQLYCNNKPHAFVSMGLVAAGVGASIYLGMDYRDKKDEVTAYKDMEPKTLVGTKTHKQWAAKAYAAQKDMNDAADLTTYALIGTGVVWAANIVDAALLGRREAKRVKKLYFTALPLPSTDGLTFNAQLALRF